VGLASADFVSGDFDVTPDSNIATTAITGTIGVISQLHARMGRQAGQAPMPGTRVRPVCGESIIGARLWLDCPIMWKNRLLTDLHDSAALPIAVVGLLRLPCYDRLSSAGEMQFRVAPLHNG
jgi:hypothetical protein